MYYKILGPLEVEESGRRLEIGGAKQRALLTILLLHANETVSRDVLIDELWGARPPAGAAHGLETHVSRLRKILHGDGREVLLTRPTGYLLRLNGDEVDLGRFDRLAEEGRAALRAGHQEQAATRLRHALALWRGRPFDDVAFESFAQVEISRVEERHAAASEWLFEAELARGRHAEVVDELTALVRRYPLRERLHAQLMLALYRSGRQAEALDVYRSIRRRLVEELGIEPGVELRELEQKILRHDPALQLEVSQERDERTHIARRSRSRGVFTGAAVAAVVLVGGVAAVVVASSGSPSPSTIPSNVVGAVGVLDARSAKVTSRPTVLPAAPTSIAAGGGYVWVTQASDRRVRQVDPATGTIHQAIKIGTEPS